MDGRGLRGPFHYGQQEAYKAYLRGQTEGWGKTLELLSHKDRPLALYSERLLASKGEIQSVRGTYSIPTSISGVVAEYRYIPNIQIPEVTLQISPIV